MAARAATTIGARGWLTLILAGAVLWSALAVDTSAGVIHGGGLTSLGEFSLALFRPDLSPGFLATVGQAIGRTLAYAVAGMTVALAIGLPGGLLASGFLVRGSAKRAVSATAGRGLLAILRAVHELVWAMLFVAAVGLSPIAGVLAIGIPYGGIVGRFLSERLQDVPQAPLASLKSTGASEWGVLLYGRIPMAGPEVVSYLFYRLECAVRAAAILSFVGLGGIGFRISIALDDLRFDQVWTLIFALIALVVSIDLWSAFVRRRLVL